MKFSACIHLNTRLLCEKIDKVSETVFYAVEI